MKKIILLVALLGSACTISDTYWKPDVGANNVASVNRLTNSEGKSVYFSGACGYLLGIKLNNNCSPDKIANEYGLQTITEVNTHWQWWIFPIVTQETTIVGIPKTKK